MKLKKALRQVPFRDMILVMLQFILLVLFFILPEFGNLPFGGFLRPIGYGAVVLGCALIVWASISLGKGLSPFPSPNAEAKLVTTGAFKYVRHPIYTGLLSCLLGVAFVSGSTTRLGMVGVALFFFFIKASYEEKKLAQRFDAYCAYKKQTGRFLPRISK